MRRRGAAAGRADRRADQRRGLAAGRDGRPRGRPARRTGAGDGRHQDLHDRAARGGAAVDGTRPAHVGRDGRPGRPARPDVGRADGGAARARPGRRARRTPACRRARPRLQLRERSRVGAQAAGDGAGRCHAVFGGRLRARAAGPGRARPAGAGGGPERHRARGPGRPAGPPEGGPWRAPAGDLGRAGSA